MEDLARIGGLMKDYGIFRDDSFCASLRLSGTAAGSAISPSDESLPRDSEASLLVDFFFDGPINADLFPGTISLACRFDKVRWRIVGTEAFLGEELPEWSFGNLGTFCRLLQEAHLDLEDVTGRVRTESDDPAID